MAATVGELSPPKEPLNGEALGRIDAYWRACSYLAVGMTYLQANPLLREPLEPGHIKNRLLGATGGRAQACPSCMCT